VKLRSRSNTGGKNNVFWFAPETRAKADVRTGRHRSGRRIGNRFFLLKKGKWQLELGQDEYVPIAVFSGGQELSTGQSESTGGEAAIDLRTPNARSFDRPSSLKTERKARKTYRARDEASADGFDYIERFYNAKRRHSTIGYLSPMKAGAVSLGWCPQNGSSSAIASPCTPVRTCL
jgi:hypothetical protein